MLARTGLRPPLLLAGRYDEPVEAQVYVVAEKGIALAYELNVVVNPAEIAIRPLAGSPPVRHVQAALVHDQHVAGASALLDILRELADHRLAREPAASES